MQIRNTKSKSAVLEVIKEAKVALSHNEIHTILNKQYDRVTIYRILERLENEAIIHKIMSSDGVAKFAICDHCEDHIHTHNHIHFNCEVCHEVTCLPDTVPKISVNESFTVKEIDILVKGICAKCKNSVQLA